MTISDFVHTLATAVPPPHCTNPYTEKRPFTLQRRHNLQSYLELMAQQQPKLLLIGEAPGYRGCRLTGIPFVSPQILAGLGAQFQLNVDPFQPVTEWPDLKREASATIVWRTIGQWQPLPLLWNIFPFHPHKPDSAHSNRPPTPHEIAAGRPFLTSLLKIFPDVNLIAVGKKAAAGLASWGYEHTAVRHPSHGGAKQFQTDLISSK